MIPHLLASNLLAASLVNWSGIGKVFILAVTTGIIIVGGFSLGLVALDIYAASLKKQGGGDFADLQVRPGGMAAERAGVRYGHLVLALFFFGVCVIGVVAGLAAMLHH